jgi:phosphohistidine phosphatase SixA
VLAKPPPRRLISSPATRCIQTLGPTAEAADLPIELWDGLGPDADVSNLILCFTNRYFDRSVLCTHGEVMSPLLDWGTLRTLIRDSGSTRRALLAKGTGWRLRVTPRGKIIAFKHIVATTDGQWAAPREHSSAV